MFCRKILLTLFLIPLVSFCAIILEARAEIEDIILSPKTLIDRALEARSTSDIVKDNEIILDVNAAMIKLKTYRPSTEIYEQRLLITGLFIDKITHDSLKEAVGQITDIKNIYWHASYPNNLTNNSNKNTYLNWNEALSIRTELKFNLIRTKGIADVNFRVSLDYTGTAYILGRARSEKERNRVLRVAINTCLIYKSPSPRDATLSRLPSTARK